MFKTPASIFAALGVACVVVGFSVWGYLQYNGGTVQVSKIDTTNPAYRAYDIKIDSTSWQDTGVWVKTGQFIVVYGEPDGQPFEISSESGATTASMNDGNKFNAVINLTSFGTFSGAGWSEGSGAGQEKVFIRLHSGATRPIAVKAMVVPIDEERMALLKRAADGQTSWGTTIVTWVVGIMVFVATCFGVGWLGAKWEDG